MMAVTPAVRYSVLSQIWSIGAGPMTVLIIIRFMSSVEQGYYYTFNSVLALQVLVELGLGTVIAQIGSHEWGLLQKSAPGASHAADSLGKLSALLRQSVSWYSVCAIVATTALSAGGIAFFSRGLESGIAWRTPWILLCVLTGASMVLTPCFAILEACNENASVYKCRLLQGVCSTACVVAGVAAGAGLYALVIAAAVRLAIGGGFLAVRHQVLLKRLWRERDSASLHWRTEVWPLQWRIATSWISGYLVFSAFTPVMFHYKGAACAGQTGMTLTIIGALESISLAWVSTRAPQFGQLLAVGRTSEVKAIFVTCLRAALGIASFGALVGFGTLAWLHREKVGLVERMLPLLPFGIFLLQRIVNVAISAMAVYIRSHKIEPLMIPSVINGVLVGSSTLYFGQRFGPLGAATGFLVVTLIWALPVSYSIFRRLWSSENSASILTSLCRPKASGI